jgi:hypothetical protein
MGIGLLQMVTAQTGDSRAERSKSAANRRGSRIIR